MEIADMLRRLRSESTAERTAATYEVGRNGIISDENILMALRENLSSSDDDLVEITVMRIGVRAKDCAAFDAIGRIFETSSNELILSACAFSLTSLAACGDSYRIRALAMLQAKLASSVDEQLNAIYDDQVQLLTS